ncbi:mitochondrial import receptor subunit TOM22 homolog isoform X2 [Chrysoperla carnea]|nr:mitochondrial import receptor subunit TOM22 homolog isoform X2 [Chrysoperla carnea]
MESQEISCKDLSPEKTSCDQSDFEDEPDETFGERLWGLTEMFPDSVRLFGGVVFDATEIVTKGFYSFSRSALWIFFSSSIILFAPILMECERVQVEDMQRNQQKQMLLGPNAAIAGGLKPTPS